ncbi:hypothetical protein B0H16DRAFT_1826250, partial [Mycena metata]
SDCRSLATKNQSIEQAIEALEENANKLEANLDLVVYPVLTLPPEITSKIFLQCLPTHGRVEPSPSRAPLLLTQVCHHWRQVTHSTCGLWSSLYISPTFQIDAAPWAVVARDDSACALLQTWFPRAKASPLS